MAVWIGNLRAAQSIVGILERLAKGCTDKTNSTGEDPALQKNNEKRGHDVSAAARNLRYRAPTGGASPPTKKQRKERARNSQKGERRAEDFLRWLCREGRLSAGELSGRFRALARLAAGKLRPALGGARGEHKPRLPATEKGERAVRPSYSRVTDEW